MELEQRWSKPRDLLESIDKLKEERREFNESIKSVEADIDRIIADGGEAKAWDELQERWNRLGILRSHRRANKKEIAELKTRAGSIIEDGTDPADDGQTGLFTEGEEKSTEPAETTGALGFPAGTSPDYGTPEDELPPTPDVPSRKRK